MKQRLPTWLLMIIAAIILAGCSSTTLSGAWKSPEFQGPVSKIYLVGLSQNEVTRRMFETQFAQELAKYGITGIPSYKDLDNVRSANIDTISALMQKNGADSMLITRLVGKRTEQVVTPGYISEYRSWPRSGYYPRAYSPSPHYRHWGSYYNRCCTELIYEPPTVHQYEIATIEANIYEAESGELIWAAQLETVIESSLQNMVTDFIGTVMKDLREQGLL